MVLSKADRMGVRAMHRFSNLYRAAGSPVGVDVDPDEKDNEPWRRITNMTVANEWLLDRKERRAGIRALVVWIEDWVLEYVAEVRAERRACGGAAAGVLPASRVALGVGGAEAKAVWGAPVPAGIGGGMAGEAWACEGQSREVLAAVCLDLNISKHKLGELIREYRGISAAELIDGIRVRPVKAKLAELLKRYALDLWMHPGMNVGVLLMDERLKVYGGGNSEYFVDPSEDFRKQDLCEAIPERREALLARFDAGWKRGEMSRDGFAVELGFRSFAELNRACLNVFGKSVRQVAWAVGCEIVDYYLAKEQQELCDLAYSEHASPRIARARYLYHGSARRPEGARIDAGWWASLDATWRAEMGAWLETG